MNKLTSVIISGFIAISSSSVFAASISLPDNMQITELNGVSVADHQHSELTKGQHLLTLRYIEDFSTNADESAALIKSKSLYWNVVLQGDEEYEVTLPQIETIDDAQKFIQNPLIKVNSKNGLVRTEKLLSHNQLMSSIMEQHQKMVTSY
jgi:uncharacterized protein YccT (UPF0319 family)